MVLLNHWVVLGFLFAIGVASYMAGCVHGRYVALYGEGPKSIVREVVTACEWEGE